MNTENDELDALIYAKYAEVHHVYAESTERTIAKGRRAQLRKFLLSALPRDRSAWIVDIGCGDGALLCVAAELGYRNLSGVDRAESMVAIARRRTQANIKAGDAIEFLAHAPDESVDCFILFDVLEHVSKRDLIALLSHVYRALKTDGKLLLHVPNGASPYFGTVRYGDITHKRAFTAHSLNQLLRAFGFAEIECKEDVPIAHGVISFVRLLLWRLFKFLAVLRIAAETGQFGDHYLTVNFFVTARKPDPNINLTTPDSSARK